MANSPLLQNGIGPAVTSRSSLGDFDSQYGKAADPLELDVLVIGGGFSGCRLLYELRKSGFNVKLVESGSDLGGVWYWNSYPGARVDSEYTVYALDIPEVWKTWTWTERFPGYKEIREYFAHIDKSLNLKKDCVFDSKVVSAAYNADSNIWEVYCANGRHFRTRYLISSMGFAAKRYIPDWKGLETFQGIVQHSSFWDENLDLRGKNVAIVGQGATGIQIVQESAKIAANVTVFIRTPIFAMPMVQKRLSVEEQIQERGNYGKWFQERYSTHSGFLYSEKSLPHSAYTPEELEARMESAWTKGGFNFSVTCFNDTLVNLKANRILYDFWVRKQGPRVHDPAIRNILIPPEPLHPVLAKRPSLEQDYYEQFNKPHVHLVDIKTNPIQEIVSEGIVTSDGHVHKVDVIALATGFDAVTGGLLAMDIKGLNGRSLRTKWSDGIYTWLGIATSGFPNFFFTYGPQAPTALSNGPSATEPQCFWIVTLLEHLRESKKTRIDAVAEREGEWRDLVLNQDKGTVRESYGSSYNGANIPGKKREALNWGGGVGEYNRRLEQAARDGYEGFVIA